MTPRISEKPFAWGGGTARKPSVGGVGWPGQEPRCPSRWVRQRGLSSCTRSLRAAASTHRGWGISVMVLPAAAAAMDVNGSSQAGSCSACEPVRAGAGSVPGEAGRATVLAVPGCSRWRVPRRPCPVPARAVARKILGHGGTGGAGSVDCPRLLCPAHPLLSPQRWRPSGRSW